MKRNIVAVAVAGLLCLQACAADDPASSDVVDISTAKTPTDDQSSRDLMATFDQLPASVEPSLTLSEESPPRLVVRTGRAFQTMDFINDELSDAFVGMGFTRSTDDETVWTSQAGIRIDVGSRPTLLVIDFSG